MGDLGAKLEVVNAQAVKVRFGATPDDYILAINKDIDFVSPQKRVPTGAGNIFFTMLPDNKMKLSFPYTTGEVGLSVPANFDEMIKRNSATKEVPTNIWRIEPTDQQGTPNTNIWTQNAKCTRVHWFAAGEGETILEIELQIIDDEPAVTN